VVDVHGEFVIGLYTPQVRRLLKKGVSKRELTRPRVFCLLTNSTGYGIGEQYQKKPVAACFQNNRAFGSVFS